MDSSTNTVRGGLGSLVFSYVANRGALVAAVVTVLLLVVRPLSALVGGALTAAYLFGGYDIVYHALTRRVALGPLTDFVARTVLLLAGVLAVPVVLIDAGMASGPLRATAVLFRVALGVLLLVAGALVALEGVGLLRGRIAVFRSTPYVGQEMNGRGLITVEGEAEHADEEEDRRVMTDGGRQRTQERDPFAGTEFESAAPAESESTGRRSTPADGRRPEFASALFDAVREGRPITDERDRAAQAVESPDESETVTVDASMVLDPARTPAADTVVDDDEGLPHVDAAAIDGDPVAVDADTSRVVATRSECTPDAWRAAVVDWLVESFERRHGVDLGADPAALNRLQAVAARTRRDLARRTRTEILLPFVAEVDGATVHLRRSLAAVGPDGRPRSTPPFGDANPVDYSRDLVDRVPSDRDGGDDGPSGDQRGRATTAAASRTDDGPGGDTVSSGGATVFDSAAEVDPSADPVQTTGERATGSGADAPSASSNGTVHASTETTEHSAATDSEGDSPETPDTTAPVDGVGRTTDPGDTTETAETRGESTPTPVAPHTGVETVYHRRRRRTKVARPRPLVELPVDPGQRVDEALPDGVPVGEMVPPAVASRLPAPGPLSRVSVPDRISLPGVPDVYEDDDAEPGVRTLADHEVTTARFQVDGFGEVTVDPDGLATFGVPDASGSDGPGLWYETRFQPGDELTVLGYAEERDGTTTMRGDPGPFVVGRGDAETFASSLTKGGLARVGAGTALVAGGLALVTPALPAGLVLAGTGAGAAGLAVSRSDTSVAETVSRVLDRLPSLDR